MASGPITSWQIEGENVEVVTDFFLGSKVTADGDCSHEIRRQLLWQESYDKPTWCVERQRHYSANKGTHSQGTKVHMVFLVATYGCESWNVKKAERQRIDVF